ncbi:MAG: site-specific DNA-methyltransferase [Patescibacteria group bacterium]|nr:site-specific DNA-methyltransferase [Patescibacteria group bacterium]
MPPAKAGAIKIARNARQRMDGLDLMRTLADRSVAAVFIDGQYRSVLDRQNYGDEGERGEIPQMDDAMMSRFVAEAGRILRSSGHLFLFIDKYLLVSGKWHAWLPEITPMREVDCQIWDKERIGQGWRFRCRWEAMIVIQKGPVRADVWKLKDVPDVARAKADRARHRHAKPVPMIEAAIRCVTEAGDIVVDPAAGSYTVLDACRSTGRVFIGCDIQG